MSQALLERIALGLERRGIEYMVIGGQAVLVHGTPRLTVDIDVTLGTDIERLPEILDLAAEAGWTVLAPSPADFVAQTLALPLRDDGSGFRIDFVFSRLDYEREAIRRGTNVQIGKALVRFASAEDLIIHKVIAGRPRDLDDVRSVLLKNPGLDSAYIRQWLTDFEVALDQPLLARFEALVRDTQP